MDAIIIALIQLTHQMALKSTCKALTGYEAMMYAKLCDFVKGYVEMLKRSTDEKSNKTEGGST